ncbi:MAG: acyltransferase family protein, partial [Verrucomicrobiota bacterium]
WLAGFGLYRSRNRLFAAVAIFVLGLIAIQANTGGNLPRYHHLPVWVLTWSLPFIALALPRFFPQAGPNRLLNRLGDASYPLYLCHIPVFAILFSIGIPTVGLLYLAVAVAISVAIDRWFDQPIKQWLRRRSTPPVPLPGTADLSHP